MSRITACILASIFCLFGSVGLAADVPKLTGVFNDPQNIVSPEKRDEITAFLKEQEARTTNQIVVLVIPTLGGEDSVDYAKRVFDAWKLGHEGKDNGVLVVIAKKDGAARIMPGNGLQGALTDPTAKQIIADAWPLLKKGKIGSGILQMVKAIDQKVGMEFTAQAAEPPPADTPAPFVAPPVTDTPPDTQSSGASEPESMSTVWMIFWILVFAGFVVLVVAMASSKNRPAERTEDKDDPARGVPPPARKYTRPPEEWPRPQRRPHREHRPSMGGTSRRQYDDGDDGLLTGLVVGSLTSRDDPPRHSSYVDSGPSVDYTPSRAPDPEPAYRGWGGETDGGGAGMADSNDGGFDSGGSGGD